MRIAVDTGILVRANVKATGPARELLPRIASGGHTLLLSPFVLEQIRQVLAYPRIQKLYALTNMEIESFVQSLENAAELVNPVVRVPVVLADPTDDPVLYTAVAGRTDVLCALDRHFYHPAVLAFCRDRGIEIMSDVELLKKLRDT
ncbi:MAG TPA: putative toxin-antitoxin system toxin component, PIN family [Bryobacteraceae bacterium]|nr:putative toxin-antitoxin system toxin component, PIN family [Bryobacteraceae bacterium]